MQVSQNTLARVKRLGERVEEESRQAEAALPPVTSNGRSRHRSGAPSGYLSSGEGSRTAGVGSRRRRSSVSSVPRPVRRSVSAHQPLQREEREEQDMDMDGRDGVVRHLKSQFQSYSKLGDRRSDGSHISCSQSDKWLKQVKHEHHAS